MKTKRVVRIRKNRQRSSKTRAAVQVYLAARRSIPSMTEPILARRTACAIIEALFQGLREGGSRVMPDPKFSRRAALLGTAVLPVIREAMAQSRPRNIVVSSAN